MKSQPLCGGQHRLREQQPRPRKEERAVQVNNQRLCQRAACHRQEEGAGKSD